ncbi:Protein CBG14664 [Caenorhabditis briggsae]|uniref:Uncharacterized protein n=2 Tax=Caenorhabditis briggsae TaxID=6238 RepID=A0AAE9FEW1_CAEBR|nr:Protein CBG14664 [Caenorhabditis briggsae]ULT82398.1 hypothetical protein L3Y34_011984 [Caenorhabditis briggsae]UMM41696.1 hypothetical protein L5515_017846 [Caenorhabditis briggsae]CAP33118.1 Protein CBG14664 [Caenorhabditis briggsae]
MHFPLFLLLIFFGAPAFCAPDRQFQEWVGGEKLFSNDISTSPVLNSPAPTEVSLDPDQQAEVEAKKMTARNIAIDLRRIIIICVFLVLIVYDIWMRAMGPAFQVIVKYQPPGEKRFCSAVEEV